MIILFFNHDCIFNRHRARVNVGEYNIMLWRIINLLFVRFTTVHDTRSYNNYNGAFIFIYTSVKIKCLIKFPTTINGDPFPVYDTSYLYYYSILYDIRVYESQPRWLSSQETSCEPVQYHKYHCNVTFDDGIFLQIIICVIY